MESNRKNKTTDGTYVNSNNYVKAFTKSGAIWLTFLWKRYKIQIVSAYSFFL